MSAPALSWRALLVDSAADRAGIVAGDYYASVEGENGPTFYHLGGDVIVSSMGSA